MSPSARHGVDQWRSRFGYSTQMPPEVDTSDSQPTSQEKVTLHYTAPLGFHHLITFLVVERLQDVNATDSPRIPTKPDSMSSPLHVPLRGGHVVPFRQPPPLRLKILAKERGSL